MEFEMVRIDEFMKSGSNDFNLSVESLKMKCCLQFTQGMEMAIKLADKVDGICIAVIPMNENTYVMGRFCYQGQIARVILFNATRTDKENADIHVFISNPDSPNEHLIDDWVKFKKGEIFEN